MAVTYSIISVITNSYDSVPECGDTESFKNLLVTDTPIDTISWDTHLIQADKHYPFDTVFNIRWNPFKYLNTDYIIWVDGSIHILSSLRDYIYQMEFNQAEFATLRHPWRTNIQEEYFEWCKTRNYDKQLAFKWMLYMLENGYNPSNSGLYQVSLCIFKNSTIVREFCKDVLITLHTFDKQHIERLDQTIVSFLLKTKYSSMPLLELDSHILQCPSSGLIWKPRHPRI